MVAKSNFTISRVVFTLLAIGFVFLCLTVDNSESRKTVVVKKEDGAKLSRHLRALEQITGGLYASNYGYGGPTDSYKKIEVRRKGKVSKRKGKKLRKRKVQTVAVHSGLKNYARKYKTWTPSKKTRTSTSRNKKKRPYDSTRYENEILIPSSSRTKKRRKKHKMSPLQRPSPPPEPEEHYNDYDFTVDPGLEDYFPEETREPEEQYIQTPKRQKGFTTNSRPKKKKKKYPPPESAPAEEYEYTPSSQKEQDGIYPPYIENADQYTVSYSNFIKHPSSKKKKIQASPSYTADDYLDESESQNIYKDERKKYAPKAPVHYFQDDKRLHSNYHAGSVYDDAPSTLRTVPKDSSNGFYPNEIRQPDYRVESIPARHEIRQPDYRVESIPARHEIRQPDYRVEPARPDYRGETRTKYESSWPDTRFSSGSSYTQNYDPPAVDYRGFTASPTDVYAPSPMQPVRQPPTSNYNAHIQTRLPVHPTPYNPVQETFTVNTDTYRSGYQSDASSHRFSTPYTGYTKKYNNAEPFPEEMNRYTYSQKSQRNPDDEFLNRHSSLYNNGLSGIPIQGDGFSSHSSDIFKRDNSESTKEYDIGYGELQYDENPTRG